MEEAGCESALLFFVRCGGPFGRSIQSLSGGLQAGHAGSDPANIPAAKAWFLVVQGEMWFNLGSDWVYPGFVGAAAPQLP
jgi:hypothetical protein